MAKGTREIRRKIKSITNTRQITKAMELVSASKMRRAVSNTLAMRPYARLAEALLKNLADRTNKASERSVMHPLLAKRPIKKVLVVVVSSDRGLCGGLNAQLFRKLSEYIKAEDKKSKKTEVSFVAVGKKAQDFLRRTGQKIIAAYPAMSNNAKLKDTYAVSRMVINDYVSGVYDKIVLVYTDFVSAIKQDAVVRRLLPLSRYALEEMIEGIETGGRHKADAEAEKASFTEYVFEPSPETVLEMLLPRLTEMQIYQAVLEAAASEHSARMFAMRNATDNATEFINDLTLAYNQIRQASITAELAEISAGRAALG